MTGPQMVRVYIQPDRASRKRIGWVREVTHVDMDLDNGYALKGRFLQERLYDLQIGTLLVKKSPKGGGANPQHEWSWALVDEKGIGEWSKPRDARQFLDFRDDVAAQAGRVRTSALGEPREIRLDGANQDLEENIRQLGKLISQKPGGSRSSLQRLDRLLRGAAPLAGPQAAPETGEETDAGEE